MSTPNSTRPSLTLVGEDGNAFSILGRAHKAARHAGWTEGEWKNYHDAATSGDYDNLLRVTVLFFEVDA
jgi:hypothetical protein